MKILRKQTLRNLKNEWLKYLSTFLLVAIGLGLIISVSAASDSIDTALKKLEEKSNVEDGNFSLFVPLNDKQVMALTNNGVTLEENFYVDIIDEKTNATVRLFKNRELINLVQISKGRNVTSRDEIVLEQHYAKLNSLDVGDKIRLNKKDYNIVGLGYSIDYDSLFKQEDGAYPDSKSFSTAFVSAEEFSDLKEKNKVEYYYSYLLSADYNDEKLFDSLIEMKLDEQKVSDKYMMEIIEEMNDDIDDFRGGAQDIVDGAKDIYEGIDALELPKGQDELYLGAKTLYENTSILRDSVYEVADDYLTVDWQNLITFIKRSENRRIIDYREFAATKKFSALPMGVALILALAFLVAVIVTNDIKKQSRTIGTLYAMGYNSNELTSSFIVLPVIVITIASIMGTVLGFNVVSLFTSDYVANGCIVDLPTVYPVYLLIYGLIIPPIFTLLINWYVIKHTLSKPVLYMLKNSNIEPKNIEVRLNNMKFKYKYQFRQFLREILGYTLLFISLILTIFMMVFSVTLYGTLSTWVDGCDRDINYTYKYYYKFPSSDIPVGGEAVYYKPMKATFDLVNSQMDIQLWGLQKNSKYFDYELSGNKSHIYISNSAQSKFGWEVGDKIYLSNPMSNDAYCFTVAGVVDFSTGLYLFMDIGNMRKVFGKNDEYWNVVLSNKVLNIDVSRLATTVSKNDTVLAAQRRTDSLMVIVYMLMGMGIFVFVGIFYLMMKIITEKSINSISILKILGFTQGEVQQLYLINPLIVVVLSSAISIPLSKWIVSVIYPYIISGVTTGMPVVLPFNLLLILISIIFVSYLVVHLLLAKKISNISDVEILRSNE